MHQGSHFLCGVPVPGEVKNIISGSFVSMSYIKEDMISRMYLESYTKITESCFSFMVLLRFKPGCFHGNHTGPGSRLLTFGSLQELYDLSIFSFFLSWTSLSSATRSVFLKNCLHRVTYLSAVQRKPILRHFIFIVIWPQMYPRGTLLPCYVDPLIAPMVCLVYHKVYNATEDRDPIVC